MKILFFWLLLVWASQANDYYYSFTQSISNDQLAPSDGSTSYYFSISDNAASYSQNSMGIVYDGLVSKETNPNNYDKSKMTLAMWFYMDADATLPCTLLSYHEEQSNKRSGTDFMLRITDSSTFEATILDNAHSFQDSSISYKGNWNFVAFSYTYSSGKYFSSLNFVGTNLSFFIWIPLILLLGFLFRIRIRVPPKWLIVQPTSSKSEGSVPLLSHTPTLSTLREPSTSSELRPHR